MRYVLLVLVAFSVVCVSDVVDAGPIFGRRRARRNTEVNVNTRTPDAPVAPANICTDDYCAEHAPAQQVYQAPIQQAVPTYAAPIQTYTPAPIQPIPAEQSVVLPNAEARVDKLLSALEARLGLKPEAAVTGDPSGLLNALPQVRITIESQGGEPQGTAIINLRDFVLETLSK